MGISVNINLMECCGAIRNLIVESGKSAGVVINNFLFMDDAMEESRAEDPLLIGDNKLVSFESVGVNLDRVGYTGAIVAYSVSKGCHVERAVQAIQSGFQDYIVAIDSPDKVVRRAMVSIEKARQIVELRRRAVCARNQLNELTKRESEVLSAITKGNSNKQIARALQISPRTVEIHRSNMMKKIGARNVGEAVRIAMLGEFMRSPLLGRRG
ncbi:response regulator transcription factor [Erythrobacter sp. GH1-10]|uniref:response regulator transcription factor n=1 Tax=Erythrobacter sp. GH1-10 TaxID=3349334 RepID=UPI003877A57B